MRLRVQCFAFAAVVYAVGLAICAALLGVQNLYAGESPLASGAEVTGTARIGECARSGPISEYGFGYWWDCEVTVSLPGPRQVVTVLGHSIVTPEDRGGPVRLEGHCSRTDPDDCTFGRGGHPLVGMLVPVLGMVSMLLLGSTLFLGGAFLMVALLGADLAWRLIRRRLRPNERPPDDQWFTAVPEGRGFRISMGRLLLAVVLLNFVLYTLAAELL
ncbi:DUF6346 domain-containing protein [Plantactinospora sp. WMMB782]|uniref:DUF6346 domain-containing protein n=1 Tax=Plantactinospora sp. WMMB782 TaxID=3404121 RepID=UPI003B941357